MTGPHIATPPLECPICSAPLERTDGVFACSSGHSFDVAREGYVNLLPSQHKSRGMQGDVAEMLSARRRFLDAGHYEPLARALDLATRSVLEERPADPSPAVVEVGCGEGYYIGHTAASMASSDLATRPLFIGTDLSKSAVRLAAKRYRDALFFVADTHRRLYLRDASVRVLLDVFAPRNASEFARVVAPGGSALIVLPSPRHLQSARDALGLLGIEEDKEQRVVESLSPAFALAERTELEYTLTLAPADVHDLVGMGPNHWHDTAPHDSALVTQASFLLLRLRRAD